MDKNENKYIAVAYKLYTGENDEKEMMEEATAEQPFAFISGFGFALDAFEKAIVPLKTGDDFDFTLSVDEGYGPHDDEKVVEVGKEVFMVDGKFDTEHIHEDAIVPLINENHQRFFGVVLNVGDDKVTLDLNHPLAGLELNFVGKVVESRDATKEEIEQLITAMSKGCGGCGGNCDSGCGGNCDPGCGREGGCN